GTPALLSLIGARRPRRELATAGPHRERVLLFVVTVQGDAHLLEVVGALAPPRRLAGCLDGGEQQGDQDGDDRDYHQQLDQRETAPLACHGETRSKKGDGTLDLHDETCFSAGGNWPEGCEAVIRHPEGGPSAGVTPGG